MLILLALLMQDDLTLKYEQYDRLKIEIKSTTEVTASDGLDSKHTVELDISYECASVDKGVITFDGEVLSAKVAGTMRNREFTFTWKKGAGRKATGREFEAFDSLEKPFKLKAQMNGMVVTPGLGAFYDLFPIFSPSALIGLATPLGKGRTWKTDQRRYELFSGFTIGYGGAAGAAADEKIPLTGSMTFASPETEVPIEGMVQVKGSGTATSDFHTKKQRGGSGKATISLSSDQGGLKRAITQSLEWKVK